MKNLISILLGAIVLGACGGSPPAPTDPSSQTTTTATPGTPTTPATPTTPDPASAATTPATPAAPAATPTAPSTPATAATDATPASAPCPAAKDVTAKDLASCKTECKKLDDKAPAGSKCVPPRTACLSNCDTKFKK